MAPREAEPGRRRTPGRAGSTAATLALAAAGIDVALHAYDHDARAESFGLEAAQQLGLDPRRVLKTLMATVDGVLCTAVVPVAGQLDLKALARVRHGSRAQMAPPEVAERATGYVVGGISPIGQRRRHPTVLDATALEHPTVFVSAGRRGLDLEITPADLARVTEALIAAIGRPAAG